MTSRLNFILASCLALIAAPLHADTVESHGANIHYKVLGEGEPVVMLHGLLVDWDFNFGELARRQSENNRIIAIDLRGHGKSDKSHLPEGYGPIYIDDVLAVMDAAGVESAHVVGYSLGGYIALKFAMMYPERTRSLVLAGSGYKTRDYHLGAKEWSQRFATADTIASGFAKDPDKLPPGYREVFNRNSRQAMIDALTGLEALAVDRTQFGKLDMPILGIFGDQEYSAPKMVAPIQAANPDMKIVIIPDANHLTALKSERFRNAVGTFLTRHSE